MLEKWLTPDFSYWVKHHQSEYTMEKPMLKRVLKMITAITLLISVGTVMAQDPTMPASEHTVFDVINTSNNHTTFASLLVETGLSEMLSQSGTYTVVAPTNAAFSELGESLETLRESPEQLQQFVRNHLLQGTVSANEVEEALNVSVSSSDESPSNGVVHVVDKVVMQRQ